MISVKNWKFFVSLFLDKMSLEILIMSDDHPSRKLALLKYKNIYFTKSRNCNFFQGGLSSKTANFLYVFFDSISLEIMSDDHPVKKRSPRIYKYGFHVVPVLNFFSSGWAMTFVKNWKSYSLFFEQNGLWKMFDDRQVRKQALLD